MRAILLLLALSALSASAESPQAVPDVPQIACGGCLVLTPAEVEQEKAALGILLQRAFDAGRKHQAQTCASLI